MTVATRYFRIGVALYSILYSCYSIASIYDNRYFPWFSTQYTASDSSHGNMILTPFFLSGGTAFSIFDHAEAGKQTIFIPELYGKINIFDIANSLELVGKANPIPDDWRLYSDIVVNAPYNLDGQGMQFSWYAPVYKHIGFGMDATLVKLSTMTSLVPDVDTANKLMLGYPGNLTAFHQMIISMYKELGIKQTSNQMVSSGDIVCYANIYDIHQHRYKFVNLDWGVQAGVIIPAGTKIDPYNLASLPLGSVSGSWGWFIAPRAEFEIKDDLKFGCQFRITKRLSKTYFDRVQVAKEQPLFGAAVTSVCINPGTTFSFLPYFAVQDIRAGFGVLLQYNVTVHQNDSFKSSKLANGIRPLNLDKNFYSGWTQEYITIRLFYDIAHDKVSTKKPLVYFSWDIPVNYIDGRAFAKTNRVSLGCIINF